MRKKISKSLQKEHQAGYLFALPWFIGFAAFTIGPIIASLVLSFTRYEVILPAKFIGLTNYKSILWEDNLAHLALWNTVYMIIFGVPLQIIVALGIALLLNMDIKGMSVYRTIYYMPAIVPIVASSLLWIWILDPMNGILNWLLSLIGIAGPGWIGSEVWSKPSMVLMQLWASGATMIILLAGLKGIPTVFYEGAEIDGANFWSKFIHITLPLLTPTLFFVTIIGIIAGMQIFTQAYIMTGGGPADSTLFYVFYLYNNAFSFFRMGYASALSWILFVIVFIITVVQLRIARYWVHYEI